MRKISHGIPYANSTLEEYEYGFNQAFVDGISNIPWVRIDRRKIERSEGVEYRPPVLVITSKHILDLIEESALRIICPEIGSPIVFHHRYYTVRILGLL